MYRSKSLLSCIFVLVHQMVTHRKSQSPVVLQFCYQHRPRGLLLDKSLLIRGLKYPLLAKRLDCMVISGATSAESLDILQPERLSAEMISQMEEEFSLLRGALEDSGMTDKQLTFLNIEWYAGVLARIRINAFRIELAGGSYEDLLASAIASVESEAAVGNAVYMLPSFYNHDCDPNTHIIWLQNVEARLKALREIEAGEELRICYIDASMDRDARRNLLLNGFGFECRCPRLVVKQLTVYQWRLISGGRAVDG
ncbi:SET domain protein 38 [Artemisia annua]|uniref:SET domain protein 38 n=1 Tax=Artemisia annua TaxID=35608 RepID=A0A2U1NZA5_ARTAN|nr:SET domain protein 38 [Artemisia annua]